MRDMVWKMADSVSLWVFVGCIIMCIVYAIWGNWFMMKWMGSAAIICLGIGIFIVAVEKALGIK